MGDEMHSAEGCPFKKQLADLEEEHNRMSKNLHMSAVYGTSLLEENKSLKLQIKETQTSQEILIQESHHLKMQLEISQKSQASQLQEIETLKEAASKSCELAKMLKLQEEEKHRKEVQLTSDLACLKDQTLAQKEEMESKIKDLELQLEQLKTAEKPSMSFSCDHEEEIAQLQTRLELSNDANARLEEKLFGTQNQLIQSQNSEKKIHDLHVETEYQLEKKEKELAATEKLLEEKRVEVLELQALLEAERVSQTNPDKRGNSIFSEVEDRRQQVERQLAKLTTLLDREKKKSIDLQAEIVKVRNQLAYAAFGGTGPDQSKHVEQLESLLRSTNAQNQDLLKRLEQAEKTASMSVLSVPQLEDTRQWMKAMLAQEKEENTKLRAEIRNHIRSNLCQNEQMIQIGRRLNESEKNLQRARAEVVRLKIKLDELAVNENAPNTSPLRVSHSSNRVVENLKFVLEKEDETPKVEQPLKERVVRQSNVDPIDPLPIKNTVAEIINSDSTSAVEQVSCGGRSPVASGDGKQIGADGHNNSNNGAGAKRQVRMNTDVRVVYDDGDSTLETLCLEDKFTAGAKKTQKPQGKQVEVIDATKASGPVMECNQQ